MTFFERFLYSLFYKLKFFQRCGLRIIYFASFSLPQEDSDYERERTPPTPPPRKYSRRGPFKLACIGKQNSDENPLRRIAAPLKLAQAQVRGVMRGLIYTSIRLVSVSDRLFILTGINNTTGWIASNILRFLKNVLLIQDCIAK